MIYHLVEAFQGPLESTGLFTVLQVFFQVEFRAFLAVLDLNFWRRGVAMEPRNSAKESWRAFAKEKRRLQSFNGRYQKMFQDLIFLSFCAGTTWLECKCVRNAEPGYSAFSDLAVLASSTHAPCGW